MPRSSKPPRKPAAFNMRSLRRPRGARGILVVVGSALVGALLAYGIGYALIILNASVRASTAAQAALEAAVAEYKAVVLTLDAAADPAEVPCSEEDLTRLRRLVFESTVVKDIGRISGDFLVCTTALGTLPVPAPATAPDYVSPRGVSWYIDRPLLVSGTRRALIIARNGVNAVLDPNAFSPAKQSTRSFTVFVRDGTRILPAFGPALVVPAEVIAEALDNDGSFHTEGIIGAAVCEEDWPLCIAVSDTRAEARDRDGSLLALLAILGATSGAAAAFALAALIGSNGSLAPRLKRAISSGANTVHYQPQFDLEADALVGCEALVRWTEGGELLPTEAFMAEAEAEGVISLVTRAVIDRSVADLGQLLRTRSDLTLSINFAAQDLGDDTLIRHLRTRLGEARVAPRQVIIEVTERTAADTPEVIRTLEAARKAGHRVALDDFGVGYSSLSTLQTMPVDEIKIDKSFTDAIGTGAVRSSIVPAIIDMGKTLGLRIVVEGIETEEQRAYMCAHGATIGQGWLMAKAMPADELIAWAAKTPKTGAKPA